MSLRGAYVLILSIAAAVDDCRTGKVSNLLVLAGFSAGALLARAAPAAAVLGALIPLFPGFFLFRLRMLGAGDVKLLMAIGCIAQAAVMPRFLAISVFCGAGIALLLLTLTGVRERLLAIGRYAARTLDEGAPQPYRTAASEADFHFTVAVLMAAVLYAGGLL